MRSNPDLFFQNLKIFTGTITVCFMNFPVNFPPLRTRRYFFIEVPAIMLYTADICDFQRLDQTFFPKLLEKLFFFYRQQES